MKLFPWAEISSVTVFRGVISVSCNGPVSVISLDRNSYKPICEVSQLGRTSVNSSHFRWALLRSLVCFGISL